MSIVNQHLQYLNQPMQMALQGVLNDPQAYQFGQLLNQMLYQRANPEVITVLRTLYDSGQRPWDPNEVATVVNLVVRAVAFMLIYQHTQYSVQTLAEAYNWYQQNFGQPQQQMMPQGNYMPAAPSYISNPAPTYYGTPPVNMMGGMVHSNATMNPGGFVNAGNNNVPSSAFSNMKGNNTMNQQDHMPAQTSFTHFKTEELPVQRTNPAENVQVQTKPNFTRINIIDNVDTTITNEKMSVIGKVFAIHEEALAKPMLISIEEQRFLPAINASTHLEDVLGRAIFEPKTIDEIFDRLTIISRQHPIQGVLGWLDTRISHVVEVALEHRYGIENVRVPNYREERSDIDPYLDSLGLGVKEDIHQLIMDALRQYCTSLACNELTINGDEGADNPQVISVTNSDYMVTLPWIIEFNRKSKDKQVYINGISKAQLFDVLDQAWESIRENDKKDVFSIVVADLAAGRYRVYRQGNIQHDGASYYFEYMGF